MGRILGWLVAAAAVTLLMVACGTGSDPGGSDQGADTASQDQAQPESGDQSGSDLAGDSGADSDREVITNASAAVEVDDTEVAVEDLLARTADYDGHVEERQQSTDENGNPHTASLTLRVPSQNLSALLDDLDDLGSVTDVSESARDVTGTVRDLDARIQALETSTDRLLEIMETAESTDELLQAETTLSERQADLEALQAERGDLEEQIEMSTLQVRLSTEPLTTVEPDGLQGGLQSGWNAMVSLANGLLVLVGMLLPWLAVLAVPAAVIAVLIRRRIRRRRQSGRQRSRTADPPMQQEGIAEAERPE